MNWLQRQTLTMSSKVSKDVDCRELDGADQDKNLEIHVCRNSRIMKSILGSEDFHEQHRHLCLGISQFLSAKNVLIMICENGRCSSVANTELWSSTLSCYGRCLHSGVLIHLSGRDFWIDTCAGKCPEFRKQSAKTFQIHYDCVRAVSETKHWKRP